MTGSTGGFNLSDWALRHRSLVWYFMIVSAFAGIMAYMNLGREEDPSFTIKTMLIQANWPGATVEQTLEQVTERIERKLESLPELDFSRSMTTPGQTVIFVNLNDRVKGPQVPGAFIKVRNSIGDIRGQLPDGVIGPFFNDDFGDVYGNIYAFTADGLDWRQLRDHVDDVRRRLLGVPNIGKVELIGAQDEVIYIEFSTRRMAALGLSQAQIIQSLQAQNAVASSGVVEAGDQRVSLRVTGSFASEDSLREVNLRVGDRFLRLGDVATVTRSFTDPPSSIFRFNGEPAIGLGVGMKAGSNLLKFGEALHAEMEKILATLPLGVEAHLVADQPVVVEHAVGGFVKALFEAVGFVLLVSLVSLGLRAGLVVAFSIPLVLAITFLVMQYMGISLQRISLGALIIALGLLVDDAMIAVEMMVARLEEGDPLEKAATYVYDHTAFPMLTGTLVTMAGFMPIGLNDSTSGEYTYTLFVVIVVALLVSWIVAVLFVPLIGVTLLPRTMKKHADKKGFLARSFATALGLAMRFRWITIGLTVAAFFTAASAMRLVEQQFFPSSDRPELIVDMGLAQGSSIEATRAQIDRLEAHLKDDPDVESWSSYIGQTALRFVLSFDVQPATPAFGQLVIIPPSIEARDRLRGRLQDLARKEFVGVDMQVNLLPLGPPAGRPVQYRLSGPDLQILRGLGQQAANIVESHPLVVNVAFDWMEAARSVRVVVDQDKARQLGVTSQDIANVLQGVVGGIPITQVRDDVYLIDVVSRAEASERGSLDTLQNLQLATGAGDSLPLAAVARFDYALEQPVVWRRAREPTITVKGGILGTAQPATVVQDLTAQMDAFAATLPDGYSLSVAGPVEESAKAQGPIAAVVPMMLMVMATMLMVQLQSFSRLFLVFSVAPLALIGVALALLLSNSPMGFVAILGILALVGILIRNSVILIVQIEELRAHGVEPWRAVTEATEHRMRPIMLTAAAATLALIPISREGFWGPMAFSMMGGIIVGTVLTLLFLPALYVTWFRIKRPKDGGAQAAPPSPPPAAHGGGSGGGSGGVPAGTAAISVPRPTPAPARPARPTLTTTPQPAAAPGAPPSPPPAPLGLV